MAQDMVNFCKHIASIAIIIIIFAILAVSVSITHGSNAPLSHDGVIPVRVQSATRIIAEVKEDFKWVDVFFCSEAAPDKLLDQQITLNLQNTGTKHNLITAPLIATVEESAALTVKPGEKREVFRGRLGDLIDRKFDCPDKSRKKGIGISAFRNPMVHARVELVFQNPQSTGDLSRLGMRSWWFSPGEA